MDKLRGNWMITVQNWKSASCDSDPQPMLEAPISNNCTKSVQYKRDCFTNQINCIGADLE